MKNNRGFTLLELLIAATIVGILAVFATISYRNSVVETRAASAKSRLDMLGTALERFELDYPGVVIKGGVNMADLSSDGTCALDYSAPNNPSVLISCGYVENGGWSDEYFFFQPCGDLQNGSICAKSGSAVADGVLACMSGVSSNAKLSAQYKKDKGYLYCFSSIRGPQETMGATK